jgi:3-oxoacyl-[acyl-carrier-protein] synthase III
MSSGCNRHEASHLLQTANNINLKTLLLLMYTNSIIIATGKYLPEIVLPNDAFLDHEFYTKEGVKEAKPTAFIIKKFKERTGINSRRYVREDQVSSDIGALALAHALDSYGIDITSIDTFIGATNFWDVPKVGHPPETVGNMATRVLQKTLAQKNIGWPEDKDVSAYDIAYGCPGWLEGLIQADMRIKLGLSKRVAVIAAETLSRISDPHDKDSLIYADGAGVAIIEAQTSERLEGILGHKSQTIPRYKAVNSDVTDTSKYLTMGPSNNPNYPRDRRFLKMIGPNVAQLAIEYVPRMLVKLIKDNYINMDQIKYFLLHQAQEKLDHDMALKTGVSEEDLEKKVPMIIYDYANSSVATIPIMLDMILRKELRSTNGHQYGLVAGDIFLFGSIGGSMNANSALYRMPQK